MKIARRVLDDVVAHARECLPRECCGLLVGESDRIVASVRARNLADAPTRFLLDPRDHIAARRHARSQGLEIVGFYHSHPQSEAYPSPTDLKEAAYPEAIHLIVGLDGAHPDFRLFKFPGGVVEELALTKSEVSHS